MYGTGSGIVKELKQCVICIGHPSVAAKELKQCVICQRQDQLLSITPGSLLAEAGKAFTQVRKGRLYALFLYVKL